MDYEAALKALKGESVGGQLIVVRGGKHILVGKQVQGVLIVEDNDEAKAVYAEIGGAAVVDVEDEPEPVPVTHDVKVEDGVGLKDKLKK